MIRLLRKGGVRFPNNRVQKFESLEPLPDSVLQAEGVWTNGRPDGTRRVAVAFGPQYGPITAKQVEECLREAYRRAYDDLVFAGFTIDGAAQTIIQEDPDPKVRCHLAHIRPDVNMGDLPRPLPAVSCLPSLACLGSSWSARRMASGWSRWRAWISTIR